VGGCRQRRRPADAGRGKRASALKTYTNCIPLSAFHTFFVIFKYLCNTNYRKITRLAYAAGKQKSAQAASWRTGAAAAAVRRQEGKRAYQ